MKPLIRFIVGPVSNDGLKILKQSINNFKKLYSQCDLMACYNQIDPCKLKNLEITLLDQSLFINVLKCEPKDEIWKIYPPRVRMDSYEIIIDNDLLIVDKVPSIDKFLESDSTLILQGSYRFYGKYDSLIPDGYKINSGIYGMPPGFDFESCIHSIIKGDNWDQDRRQGLFDDQGIIAGCLLKYPNVIIIPNTEIFNYKNEEIVCPKANGYHFIDVNRKKHIGWEKHKKKIKLV